MNIDELTLGQVRQLQALLPRESSAPDAGPWRIGQAYLIRCVTHYALGRLTAVGRHELTLADGGWVADTGRYAECVATGKLAEFEPVATGPLIVGRGAIVDACEWSHAIPRETIS